MIHRWFDMAFTPCGKLMPYRSIRDPLQNFSRLIFSSDRDPEFFKLRHSCNESNLEYVDLAIGASGGIWAEKCLLNPDKVRTLDERARRVGPEKREGSGRSSRPHSLPCMRTLSLSLTHTHTHTHSCRRT
jgi:hypothetical protein